MAVNQNLINPRINSDDGATSQIPNERVSITTPDLIQF